MSILYDVSSNKEYQNPSRYQVLRVIYDTDTKERLLETFNQVFIPEKPKDTYHIVSPREVNRLDIISEHYYGTPTYWWAIAIANNFIDPFILEQGTMIRIPSLIEVSNINNEILTRRGVSSIK